MRLSELKTQEIVFVDANIFLYHFGGVSVECKEFIKRCEAGDIFAATGVTVLAEVCRQLMLAEAIRRGFILPQRPTLQLQKKPQLIKRLAEYYIQMANIPAWNIKIIPAPDDIFVKSQIYRSQFGLLTNDSFIPVYMGLANTTKLATLDQIFKHIPFLEIYHPSDVEPL